jgi:hypothetical protein
MRPSALARLVLLGSLLGPIASGRALCAPRGYGWAGIAVDAPVTIDFHLFDIGVIDDSGRYELQVPILTFGLDTRSPSSSRRTSLSLSFAQAPLLLFLVPSTIEPPRAYMAAVTVLMWLSGGTFRYTPGGLGNLHRSETGTTSLSLVAKSELGVHPFNGPLYVRETPGLGLAIRNDRREAGRDTTPRFACGAGLFVSVAKERGYAPSVDRGAWASCYVGLEVKD